MTGGWRATHAQVRAVAVAAVLLAVAVLGRRPDLAVLGLPFAVLAVWGAFTRPSGQPAATAALDVTTLFEGQATRLRIGYDAGGPGTDLVVVAVPRGRWLQFEPRSGALAVPARDEIELLVRSQRWGLRQVEPPQVVGTSLLGAYRTETLRTALPAVTTWPLREGFTAVDAVPRPAGLVGLHRSRRPGDGTEIAGVRPFQLGDRLRRVNWAVTARTGELHVTSTWSDRDTEVVVLLDSSDDVGVSDGIDGRSSSLDTAARAAAAIAEHYLRHGDRVRLVDTGSTVRAVRPGTGRAHLRRILDALVHADPRATQLQPAYLMRRHRIRAGSLVIVLSPLLRELILGHVVSFVHAGCTVIVVDTLPADLGRAAEYADRRAWALAWRLRLLERQGEIERLGDLGVPTVAWSGAGTLDEVLRNASRLSAAPRVRT
ncbi:MAG: DUF58 domain-containing protein [Kribbellaceae bacterium]